MKHVFALHKFCGALLTCGLLVGCADLRIHSATRDKQGQAAVTAWKAVSLDEFFKQEREQRTKLLELELKASDDLVSADRDLQLRQIASMTAAQFAKLVDARLRVLVTNEAVVDGLGPDDDSATSAKANLNALATSVQNVKIAEQQLIDQRVVYDSSVALLAELGAPVVVCDANLQAQKPAGPLVDWKPTGPSSFAGRLQRQRAILACQKVGDKQRTIDEDLKKLNGGELGAIQTLLVVVEQRKTEDERGVADAKARFDKAANEYADALKESTPAETNAKKAADAAAKLEEAVAALEKSSGGNAVLSEERLKQVKSLIESWKAGTAPGVDDKNAQVLLKMLPHLADDIRAIEFAKNGASLTPLLILREVEQSRLNAAQTDLRFTKQKVELLRQQRAAMLDQAFALMLARKSLVEAAAASSNRPLRTSWGLSSADKGVEVVSALREYFQAVGPLRQQSERLVRTRYALEGERSSALSEVNVGVWLALIGPSVQQSADFATLGLKATDLTNIISAAGVVGIARGVNTK